MKFNIWVRAKCARVKICMYYVCIDYQSGCALRYIRETLSANVIGLYPPIIFILSVNRIDIISWVNILSLTRFPRNIVTRISSSVFARISVCVGMCILLFTRLSPFSFVRVPLHVPRIYSRGNWVVQNAHDQREIFIILSVFATGKVV